MTKRTMIWIAVILFGIALVLALTTPAKAIKKDIGPGEVAKLEASGAWLVDVRTPTEFAAGHIPGAVNVPMDQLQTASASWNKRQAIVLYCATGARSANAMAYLSAQGFKKLYNLKNGVAAWTGQLTTDSANGSGGVGPVTVKTNGKPVFIDFAGST